jgi:phenylalanyl-tRNA synthetase beta chain
MRVPLPWLREYCDPALSPEGGLDLQQIEQRLTMTGTKVAAILRHGVPSVEGFVVGRVLDCQPHPDADRLRVCTVDLGAVADDGDAAKDAPPATIVCGAPNVAAGQTVAVARPGAVLPDGTKLKQAKLRGVVSEGMILSESELDLAASSEGILVLDAQMLDAAPRRSGAVPLPGTPLDEVLPIAMDVLELEITPNRPDCLGVYGVARELHAASGAPLAPAPWSEDPGTPGAVDGAAVSVECPELCPRFTARVFEDVTIAPSPPWLKARLSAAGQRPINNVVDMLLSGQPLHAFDLDHVAGAKLTVRRAREGEQVQTLDGQTRTLSAEMVVIEDADGPTSIAGLMGGARSEVAHDTTRVLLEVATWDGPNIHDSSWALGLRSEASSRFEKGLQPEQCMHAQALATRLLIELCGARVVPGTIDVGGEQACAPLQTIRLREARVQALLGVPVDVARQAEILSALDFASVRRTHTGTGEDGLEVTVPALRRADVTREVDLIEEVARIDGLERLPATLPARRGAAGRLTHAQRVRRAAEDAMVGRGLHEIVGWSFADPSLLDALQIPNEHPLRRVVALENPLSDAQSIMRPTLLGSLLDGARHNVSRGRADIAIFESGTVYRASRDRRPADTHTGTHEHHGLGVLLCGQLTPRAWRGERMQADFFTAKALLAALLERFHVDWQVQPTEQTPFLHPARSAAVLAGELQLGLLGEVHPLVAGAWGLERTATFLIDLGKLASAAPEVRSFQAFAPFPVLRQDLAVTLPEDVSAAELLTLVRDAGGKTLERVEIFDVYSGEQVGEGRRSLALALTFRALDRTLTDADVTPVRERVLAAVQAVGGDLRG